MDAPLTRAATVLVASLLACQPRGMPSPAAPALQELPPQVPALPVARLDYVVRCVPGEPDARLEVSLRATGLDPAERDLAFELPLWGEWITFDEYYVTRVRGEPPVAHDLDNRFYWRPQLPADWDGTLEIRYAIPIVAFGCAAQQQFGLLPWRTATYVHGFSANTLMRLLVGDRMQDGDRHLELIAPKGWTIATGWGGVTRERQRIDLAPDADNTALVMGDAVAVRSIDALADPLAGRIDVVQFGRHADRTAMVLELARKARAAYASSLGVLAPTGECLIITEPGLGGTHVEGAISHGHPAVEADGQPDVGTDHFLAHELFHAWLPGVLRQGEAGLEWFFEGFTDYFSLWHLAHIGRITPQQFADQLRYLEVVARQSPACGKVAFGDRTVNWREPDAERLAYQGADLLAFHLDVELRARGESGLPQLFRDLMATNGGCYTFAAIEKWAHEHDLGDAWRAYVASPALPDVGDNLVRLGFTETREGEVRVIPVGRADVSAFFAFTPAR